MTDLFLRGSDFSDSASASSRTVNKITGTLSTDVSFALVTRYNSTTVPNSTPSGWALVPGTTYREVGLLDYCALWYKIGAVETSYTWGWTTSTKVNVGVYTLYGDIDLDDLFDVVSDTVYNTNDTIIRAASMNVSKPNSPLIWFGAQYSSTEETMAVPSSPISFTADPSSDAYGTTDSDLYNRIGYGVWSSSGSTGNMDGTLETSALSKHAFAVALNPIIQNDNALFLGGGF